MRDTVESKVQAKPDFKNIILNEDSEGSFSDEEE